jgi:hypothetical protein
MAFSVYASGTDPEDPDYFAYYGSRATKGGAEALAEKILGKRIYGWYATTRFGYPALESDTAGSHELRARLVQEPKPMHTKPHKLPSHRVSGRHGV